MRKEAERRLDTMRISWEAERIELDGRLAQLRVGGKEERTRWEAGTATGRRKRGENLMGGWHSYMCSR